MFKDIPVEVGVIFEGERIRKNDMQVELSGWKVQVGPRDSSEIPKYLVEKWQP
jgi:acetyl-CoA decarbonylase/synthase complex subunit beta